MATATLVKKGFSVEIESGAGAAASFKDDDFAKAGAKIVDVNKAYQADIVLKVVQIVSCVGQQAIV
jgi:NAD/NADP transhydrogenase alpha subunit